MEFIKEIVIDKPINEVWGLLATDFGDAYKWASGINHSKSFGKPEIAEANCNNRECQLPSGKIKEVVRKFDPKNHILEYEVIEGFPFFVESGINKWQLTSVNGMTRVNMHLKVKTKGIVGSIMKPMMKMQFKGLTNSVLIDLKHYAETGKPSEKKAKELAKLSSKAA